MSHSEPKLKRKKCWTFTWTTIGRLWCLIMSHSCLRWLVSFMLVIRKRLNLQFFIEEKMKNTEKTICIWDTIEKRRLWKIGGGQLVEINYIKITIIDRNSLTLLSVLSHSNYPAISYFYLLTNIAIICSFCDRNEQLRQFFTVFQK